MLKQNHNLWCIQYSVLGTCLLLKTILSLSLQSALASSEPMLRCAAGEALGRMSQVGGDTNFVAQIAQTSFDTLKSTHDPISRTGHSLVLGCLHRYVGGMGSGQHLQTSVGILHTLTQDTSSPTVQVSGGDWEGRGEEGEGGFHKQWVIAKLLVA